MTDPARTRVLPVPPARWAPPATPVVVDGIAFAPKPELHITLVGRALGEELHATFGARVGALVDTAIADQDWHWTRSHRCLLLRRPGPAPGDAAHSLISGEPLVEEARSAVSRPRRRIDEHPW